jgi:hypothetical protein
VLERISETTGSGPGAPELSSGRASWKEGIRRLSRGSQAVSDILTLILLTYFAILSQDPLYLFTRRSVYHYLAELLEKAWRPYLVYLQELHSCPIRLDGLPTTSLTFMTPKTDIVFKAKNFIYNHQPSSDIASSRAFQSLLAISPIGNYIKNGCMTILTVHIPKHHGHSFWHLDSIQCNDNSFACDESQDMISFQVTRWGPLPDWSNFYATQRAKDIIRNIRASVSHPTHLSNSISEAMTQSLQISNPLDDPCPVFSLGVNLNSMWKHVKSVFSTVCSKQTMEIAIHYIQNIIDSNSLPEFTPVLKYHQVYRYFVVTNLKLDIFLSRCERIPQRCRLINQSAR